MRTRMKDIAESLGLSVSAVQSILRDKPGFREATRQRVFKKAKSLHYQPNSLARSLVTRKTNVLGVVVTSLSRPFFPAVLEGIDAVTYPAGYSLVVFNTEEDPVREDKGMAALLGNQIDGLIIASAHHRTRNGSWEPFRKSGVPFVLIDRFFPSVPFVGADNELVGYMATQHLLRQGYKSIAHLTGRRDIATGYGRYRGYMRAVRDAGFPVRKSHILEVDYRAEPGGQAGTMQLLKLPVPPDAIFAINDSVATGAIQAAQDCGLRVPEDFGVIGVGNSRYSELLRIPLSSVDLHAVEVGKSAASILLGMIHDKPAPRKPVFVEPTLIVRASTRRSPSL